MSSPQNDQYRGPISRERMEAAHQIYLDMVSDPNLKFSEHNKERILNSVRSSSSFSSEKSNNLPKQKPEQITETTKKSKKERPPLTAPKNPPKESGRERAKKNTLKAQYSEVFNSQKGNKSDYLALRQYEKERIMEHERKLQEGIVKRTKEAQKKYRCEKQRQNLTNDLAKIKKFEIDAQIEQMKTPSRNPALGTTYLVEFRHIETSKRGTKLLATVEPPVPRANTPQPVPMKQFISESISTSDSDYLD